MNVYFIKYCHFRITVSFNINHTIDADDEAEIDPNMDKPSAEMKSKPTFEIDIERNGKTLSFTCSFLQGAATQQDQDGYNDIFGIDEVTMYEGEWSEKNYAVAGDVLDGVSLNNIHKYYHYKSIETYITISVSL